MNANFIVKLIVFLVSALRNRAGRLTKGINDDTNDIIDLKRARQDKVSEKLVSLNLARNIDKLLK